MQDLHLLYTLSRDVLGFFNQPGPQVALAPLTECGDLERLLERSLEKAAVSCPACPELRCTVTVNILLAFSFSCSLLSFIAGAVFGRRRLLQEDTVQTRPAGPRAEDEGVRVVPAVGEVVGDATGTRGPLRSSQPRLQNQ